MIETLEARECCSTTPLAVAVADANASHPGGVNVLMGDGSVRFISQGISQGFRGGIAVDRSDPSGNTYGRRVIDCEGYTYLA